MFIKDRVIKMITNTVISKISQQNTGFYQGNNGTNTAFKASFVTLSLKNSGDFTKSSVVDSFNRNWLGHLLENREKEAIEFIGKTAFTSTIRTPVDLVQKLNFFVLAAGSGSRFKPLANKLGPQYNKINLPLNINGEQNLHILDFAIAMSKYSAEETGIRTIVASNPSGSLGDVIDYYLKGNEIKDTLVCCGDNVYDLPASELMQFFVQRINNPNKHLALIGVKRSPEATAGKLAAMRITGDIESGFVNLLEFKEKPTIQEAQQFAYNGENIANSGFFYISKEAMTKLIEEIKAGENHIKKNDAEPYDFALAIEHIHKNLPTWFGVASNEGTDIKIVKTWEDVGEPPAFYKFLKDVIYGKYLNNFSLESATAIIKALKQKIKVEQDKVTAIMLGNGSKSISDIPEEKILRPDNIVAGVHVIIED